MEMNYLKKLLIVIAVIYISGCATKEELKNNPRTLQIWKVDAPIEDVFRNYKDLAEAKYANNDILWSGGIRANGYYYGDTAELALSMEGNVFTKATYLNFDFDSQGSSTIVEVRRMNRAWGRKLYLFKELFETTVIADGTK